MLVTSARLPQLAVRRSLFSSSHQNDTWIVPRSDAMHQAQEWGRKRDENHETDASAQQKESKFTASRPDMNGYDMTCQHLCQLSLYKTGTHPSGKTLLLPWRNGRTAFCYDNSIRACAVLCSRLISGYATATTSHQRTWIQNNHTLDYEVKFSLF